MSAAPFRPTTDWSPHCENFLKRRPVGGRSCTPEQIRLVAAAQTRHNAPSTEIAHAARLRVRTNALRSSRETVAPRPRQTATSKAGRARLHHRRKGVGRSSRDSVATTRPLRRCAAHGQSRCDELPSTLFPAVREGGSRVGARSVGAGQGLPPGSECVRPATAQRARLLVGHPAGAARGDRLR